MIPGRTQVSLVFAYRAIFSAPLKREKNQMLESQLSESLTKGTTSQLVSSVKKKRERKKILNGTDEG